MRLTLVVAALAAGCAGRGSSNEAGQVLHLVAAADTVQLAPNQQKTVSFRLDNGGVPAGGRTVSFAIVAVDPAGAQGATLASSSGTTDTSGLVTVGVRAGLATDFQIQAQIATATAQMTVIVAAGPTGTVSVAPFFAPSSAAAGQTNSIRVSLYDGRSCASIDRADPPQPSRDVVPLPAGVTSAVFPFVSTGTTSAAFAQAIGAGPAVLASGCVDVPGSTLLASGTVQVALPLVDTIPDPVGTFTVTSTLTFARPLAAAAPLAAAWANLSDCPLDPAQLWLDCTLDALQSATAGDPLDCVPGAEGPVGDAIAARRGTLLIDGTGAATACRGARDSAGAESLDALVLGTFGTPLPAPVVALPAIAGDAAALLDTVRLTSVLTLAPGSADGTYAATHTLSTALFGPSWQVAVPLAGLGLPVLQAVAPASVAGGALIIGQHGFTLRLGSAARAAFGPLALAPRGYPSDVTGFVAALFAMAQAPGAGTTVSGCAALDATVCAAAGQPAGCAAAACAQGLTALAGILDGAFSAADGTGLDLQLSGTASLVAIPGDPRAERLGVRQSESSAGGGAWNATLHTALDSTTLVAPFEGVRD